MHASFQQLLQLQECLSTMFFLSVSPQALQMKKTILSSEGAGLHAGSRSLGCSNLLRLVRLGS